MKPIPFDLRPCLAILILLFLSYSCASIHNSEITEVAIKKQETANFYYMNQEYEKAKELITEALQLWRSVEPSPLNQMPNWWIEENIRKCMNLLKAIERRLNTPDVPRGV